jgi:hypothetical protein
VELARYDMVLSIFDCPEQKFTSPNRTPVMDEDAPVCLLIAVIVYVVTEVVLRELSVGGRSALQVELPR